MAVSSIAAAICQIPAGILVDSLKIKRSLIIGSGLMVALGCLLIAFYPKFFVVIAAQAMLGAASAVIPPAIAAVSLGLVGHRKLDARVSRNESFNHGGNFLAACLAGSLGQYLGYDWIFFLCASLPSPARRSSISSILPRLITGLGRGGESLEQDCEPVPISELLWRRDLLIFLASVILFHFGNAAMLPMAGQVLAQTHPGSDAITLSACIIAAQFVMVGVAWGVGKAAAAGYGRKTIFLIALGVLPVRGLLFSFTTRSLWRCRHSNPRRRRRGYLWGDRNPDRIGPHARHRTLQSGARPGRAQRRHRRRPEQSQRRLCRAMVRVSRRLSLPHRHCRGCADFLCRPHARDGKAIHRSKGERGSRANPGCRAMNATTITWSIAALAAAGVMVRPWRVPEAVWAVAGALLLITFGLLSWRDALAGVVKGTDVYLFLAGMMLLAELARQQGLFDWLAAKAARSARGSATRLFTLVFAVGTVVTIFLSNDATAVVLTPAVAAVVKAVNAREPLPYLFVCAFVANAASFVLPISNPANLVIYGAHMPPLLQWLPLYALPSALAIAATYGMLRLTQRQRLGQPVAAHVAIPVLSAGGRLTAWGIAGTSVVLLAASAFDVQLGLPTFLAGTATALLVFWRSGTRPIDTLKHVSWGVLPLVADCLFWCRPWSRPARLGPWPTCLRNSSRPRRLLPPGCRVWRSRWAAIW